MRGASSYLDVRSRRTQLGNCSRAGAGFGIAGSWVTEPLSERVDRRAEADDSSPGRRPTRTHPQARVGLRLSQVGRKLAVNSTTAGRIHRCLARCERLTLLAELGGVFL